MPAQRAEAKRLITGLGIALVAVTAIGIVATYLLRPDEATMLAMQVLREGESRLTIVPHAIAMHRTEDARQKVTATRKEIDILVINREGLQQRREALRKRCDQLLTEIDLIDIDRRFIDRHGDLATRFGHLGEMDCIRLDALDRDAEAFIREPVPASAELQPHAVPAVKYTALINDIRIRKEGIPQARRHLVEVVQNDPVTKARNDIERLVQEERFQEALDMINEIRKAYPKADVKAQEKHVHDAAQQKWETVQMFVNNRLQDASAPETPAAQHRQALMDARRRLDEVVARFGMPIFLDKAQAQISRLPE